MDDVAKLARVVKAQARRVEREAHALRQLAARLCDAADVDTSEREDTSNAEHEAEDRAYAEAV